MKKNIFVERTFFSHTTIHWDNTGMSSQINLLVSRTRVARSKSDNRHDFKTNTLIYIDFKYTT